MVKNCFAVDVSMKKKKVYAIKEYVRVWVVITFLLFYFYMVASLWILFHPYIAVSVLFLTFAVCYLCALWFYNKLGEIL